jgi:DNA-binding GntR family transcriptional regulator
VTSLTAQDDATQSVSKAEDAYRSIRAKIVNGSYLPGARLVLDRLADDVGVSTVPIREALRRLEAEGYVDFVRNLGATVSAVDVAGYAETMETLAIIEAAATAYAAPHVSKQDIKSARKLNDMIATSLQQFDPVTFSHHSHELHQLLYLPCPNPYLLGLVEREWARLRGIRRAAFAFVPDRAQQAFAEHAQLIDLIESGAPAAKIESSARAHRQRTAQHILKNWPLLPSVTDS